MSNEQRLVIVGGVAGGASAAARARRLNEHLEIVILERGPYISFANCGLPYHIGGEIPERDNLLLVSPELMDKRMNIEVRVYHEVTAINREAQTVTVKDLKSDEEYQLGYSDLILSPGAAPIRPPLPGVDDPRVKTLRNVPDMDAIIEQLDREQTEHVTIVGGGYIGLEMAEALHLREVKTALVELTDQVMAPMDPEMAHPLHQALRSAGVDLRLSTCVTGFTPSGDDLIVEVDEGEAIKTQLVVLAVGVKPEVSLGREAGLTIGERGGFAVDEHMRTNDPHIYAVGDAIEVRDLVGGQATLIPLAGPAVRQGRIAADNICGRESKYTATQGTAVCKLYDLTAGVTGASEKVLNRQGIRYEKIYQNSNDHVDYYPGATPMFMKLLFDPENGRILGAQAVGNNGIDKRIDVLAVAIRAGMTVFDLEELELSYAPPYGAAKDQVNFVGFVASNFLRGDAKICHASDMHSPKEDQFLLDVRPKPALKFGLIPGSKHISIDELRGRLDELPRDKKILVTCMTGMFSYMACRILSQNGFNCVSQTGGFKVYSWQYPGHVQKPELTEANQGASS